MTKKQPYTLLYVEDELFTREMVIEYLSEYFESIYVAIDGEEALELYKKYQPDMIITDIQIPKLNGLELVTAVREKNIHIPILITTAYTNTEYLLEAVELNLITYLIKPIDEEKLEFALNRAFKQLQQKQPNNIKLNSEFEFDIRSNTLTKNNILIPLTLSQSEFLHLLISNKNRACSYLEIENHVWGNKIMSDAALRSLVHDIRQTIKKDIIKNVSKIGYKININE